MNWREYIAVHRAITAFVISLSAQTALGLNLLNITTTSNADVLAKTILGSRVTIISATYTGEGVAAGTFTGGVAAGLGIDSGIILTTGKAQFANGPNTVHNQGFFHFTPGFAALEPVAGTNTFDAAVLTLKFDTTGGDLLFNYVFGSEEYNEFVGTYNDHFAFFLDGTMPTNNVALIPKTTTPVSINNVNTNVNSAFFVNNDLEQFFPNPPPNNNLQCDGYTKVLQVKLMGLSPGTHTITLAIADTTDSLYDSAVFVEASR